MADVMFAGVSFPVKVVLANLSFHIGSWLHLVPSALLPAFIHCGNKI